ncbi:MULTISPECIES: class V lanthionine synthetase subunit LxmK [unclassified Streptomyces]|uniref:class V lanthionine synthetase subunit LxmK n=1 Tax=unclassified Streptomyces TaxID=2593676 RepID=UPI002365BA6C|nr:MULTISPECIES: class V lanthionine synthetase subunit LxmK [unclassified Streptomyces]MDF3148362.1 class V lanthionine synthetase subunit LxmK [Streptomyces sp. T21Q-yed]WDF39830.1 class V lanthionine synthetase subunit LxmK [Streptomyces sp. T12]
MSSDRRSYQPVSLDQAPEVNEFLDSLGLGKLTDSEVTAYLGRNDNWVGTTSSGVGVFVKRVVASPEEAARRIRRSVALDEVIRRAQAPELRTPRLLGHHTPHHLMAHELLTGVSTGAELAADKDFDDELAHRAGRLIGLLHGAPYGDVEPALDEAPPVLPDLSMNEALPLPMFMSLTFAEVNLWGIVQQDEVLVGALRDLRERERHVEHRPAHCDLRLDQFLRDADGGLHLTDGEEFRLADPARDVGAFAGEWLYQAVIGITGVGTDDSGEQAAQDGIRAEPTHEDIVARGSRNLAELRPRIEAFWAGYRAVRDDVDEGLAVRATAVAGWHLIDRALASAAKNTRLLALTRAAMGIGRTALADPERFVTAMGLGEQA